MNAIVHANALAALAGGHLPPDGTCYCPACKRDGLSRADMMATDDGYMHRMAQEVYGQPICSRQFCADLLYLEWENPRPAPTSPRVKCPKCSGRGSHGSEFHYVRQERIRNDCPVCDGEGFLEQEHAEAML